MSKRGSSNREGLQRSVVAETPTGFAPVDLNRLRWRAVWIPTIVLASILSVDGLIEYLLEDTWKSQILLGHLLFIVLGTAGTFWFVTRIFRIIRLSQEEIVARSSALVRLERRFRALIEHSTDVVLILDANGTVRYASPSVARVLGHSPNDLADRRLFELVHDADRNELQLRFRELVQRNQDTFAGTFRAQHKDGSWRWLELVANNLLDDSTIQGVVCNARDTTTRKQAEDALEERARLADLSTHIGQAFVGASVLEVSLQRCVDAMVHTLDAALARIWTFHDESETLRLWASAGLSSRLDGTHARIPVGRGKVGLVARDRRPLCTNDITGDADIPDQAWVRTEALVAFAGYPLMAGDRLVGVLAVFSRCAMSEAALQALASIASEIGLHIQRHRADHALRKAHDELDRRVSERTKALAETNDALRLEVGERRRAETELQSLFDGVPVGLYRTTPGGAILRANPALLSILGCEDMGLLLERNVQDLYVDAGRRKAWIVAMERYGFVRDFEAEFHRFDGRRIWMRHNARAVRGPDGTVLHYEGAAEDITERTRADAALRHSRSRLEGIIGSVMDGIISVDADHTIVSFNAAAATIFLCPAVQAVGRPVEDFVPEWEHMERQGIARSFDDVVGLRGRRAVRREVIGVRTNGEEFPCEVSVSRVQVHAQHLYTIVARDISDRKRATRDLEKSREMLRALAARVESVREEERCAVAREIHDVLGGALTGLKMDLSWLAARLPAEATTLRDKVPGMFALIDGTVQSVRHLASSLRPGILDDLGLGPAIEWQAHEIQARVGIPCECSVDTAGVQLDPEQSTAMFRILQESLTNVARHANATRVSITLRQDTDCIVLQVTDNGQGITADEIHDPGSLGLLGMRERARLLGGDVTFAGHPGRGTVVDARIPVRRPTTRPETREPSEGAVPQDNDPSVESTAGTL